MHMRCWPHGPSGWNRGAVDCRRAEATMSEKRSVDRRDFLKSAAVTSAAAFGAGSTVVGNEQPQATPPAQASAPVAPREVDPSGTVEAITTDRPGGDFMVDVIKTLNFEFI